jgi:hypothetical protein
MASGSNGTAPGVKKSGEFTGMKKSGEFASTRNNMPAPGVKKSGEFPSMRNNMLAHREPINIQRADKPVEMVEKPLVVAKSTRAVQQVTPVEPIEVPVVTDDIVVNSNTNPAVQAVRKASMTRRSVDYPQTKREKAVAVESYEDWGAGKCCESDTATNMHVLTVTADIDDGLREAADLIEDDFVDTFADFDNFDDLMQTLRADTSELDALLDPDESMQKYSSWVVDEVRSRKSSATGQTTGLAKAPVRRVSIDNRKSVPALKRESWVEEQW